MNDKILNWIKQKWFYVLVLIAALALPFFVPNRYFFQVIMMSCLYAMGALSLNLIIGYTGQISLAHGGFFGIGAYGVALMTKAGMSFWIALPLAALIAVLIGLIIGVPALRTRGAYFAIATMCLGEIIYILAGNLIDVTGGANGIIGVPPPSPIFIPFAGEITFDSQTPQYYLVLAFLIFTIWFIRRLVFSLKGLSFMAIRGNEGLAEAVGINSFATKLLSFLVAIFFAGLAGGLYASLMGSVSPSAAGIGITFSWFMYMLLGGVATLAGPIIGAFVLIMVREYLQFLQEYSDIIFGVLLIIIMIYFPGGLMGGINIIKGKIQKFYLSKKGGC